MKNIVIGLIGFEVLTLIFCWMNSRTPMLEYPDGPIQTTLSIVVSTHVYAYAFLIVIVAFWVIFARLWKGSSRRRR